MIKAATALAFLALHFYVYHYFASEAVIPPRRSFDSFPLALDDWRCEERERMEAEVEENLGVTDYLICNYARAGSREAVGVYVGYHATQIRREGGGGGENSIHPPAHCLPGSGWDIIEQRKTSLALAGMPERPAEVNRLVIAKGNARALVYYWYQERGRVTADDWKKIVLLTWDRAHRQRTDGALVRLTVPITRGRVEEAERELLELAELLLPAVPEYVPE
jgi:EpsI family protein